MAHEIAGNALNNRHYKVESSAILRRFVSQLEQEFSLVEVETEHAEWD